MNSLSLYIIIQYVFDFIDYTLITSNGFCVHNETGNYPASCQKVVPSRNKCQVQCTNHDSCIAYSYGFMSNNCWLVVSDSRCPDLYTTMNGTIARSKDDLVVYPYSGYECYARNLGKKHTVRYYFMNIILDFKYKHILSLLQKI